MLTQQLKEIILDYQMVVIKSSVPRRIEITPLEGKATVCMGVRRGGKSTLMSQIIQKLLNEAVRRENILYLNFFDERLHSLKEAGLGVMLEAYFSLYPHKKNTEKIYCFFDEIQIMPDWEPFVDRIMRMENCEVYITGSSAQLLSKEIGTQMRGRALSWEVFPFSFREFLDFKGLNSKPPFSTKTRLFLQNAFEEYWEVGSFPEVLSLSKQLRIKVLQEYFNTVLFRDLIERHDIAHPKAVVDLARWLVDNNGALYSINSLTGYLKSLGHKVPKSEISHYITWFEDAYFFFSVSIYDPSLARVNANPKKTYCIDHAMVKAISSGILLNSGHSLENVVYIALRRNHSRIYYYKTTKGNEVDFIAQNSDRHRVLVQVCERLVDPKTRKREVEALQDAMRELNLKKAMIVTRNEEMVITSDAGEIDVIPVWRFLLRDEVFS